MQLTVKEKIVEQAKRKIDSADFLEADKEVEKGRHPLFVAEKLQNKEMYDAANIMKLHYGYTKSLNEIKYDFPEANSSDDRERMKVGREISRLRVLFINHHNLFIATRDLQKEYGKNLLNFLVMGSENKTSKLPKTAMRTSFTMNRSAVEGVSKFLFSSPFMKSFNRDMIHNLSTARA
jgi:hypothetical protein